MHDMDCTIFTLSLRSRGDMLGWVSKLATEVQQFGHDCVESIVGEEEEATSSAPPMPVEDEKKQPAPVSEDAREAVIGEETSPRRGDTTDEDDWAPTELRFVGQQTQHLASFGWGLVEKGAGMALSLLGDEPGSPGKSDVEALREVAQGLKTVDASDSVAAVKDEHPLEKLRACRGYLGMLRRQSNVHLDESLATRKVALEIILPRSIAELDYSEGLNEDCLWVGGTMVGRRIVTTRKLLSTPVDAETGEPLEGEGIIKALPDFKRMSTETCEAIARMVLEELAEIFARPSRSLDSTLADLLVAHRAEQEEEDSNGVMSFWFLHRASNQEASPKAAPLSDRVARNVVDLVNFAFCEMYRGAWSLCAIAQECATWARRTDHSAAKEIKEMSMTVRGDCLTANVDALVMLEEALEIVLSLFPEVEGQLPLEPLRIGQPIEYVHDAAVKIETEHGPVVVQATDRHTREKQDTDAETSAPPAGPQSSVVDAQPESDVIVHHEDEDDSQHTLRHRTKNANEF